MESRGKADFRALREELGITQDDLARGFEIPLSYVKNWEKQSSPYMPSDEAWEWLDVMAERARQITRITVEQIEQTYVGYGMPECVTLTYYRNAQDYREHATRMQLESADTWQTVNVQMRMVARKLRDHGFRIRFAYPTEEDNVAWQALRMSLHYDFK
ncbi:MAG: helix-turn-helix transcriptional regulator [Alloscardovia omnicolens]|nr:helix-turn-helix transcriptional regulator [Alloscardovia omnicolens]